MDGWLGRDGARIIPLRLLEHSCGAKKGVVVLEQQFCSTHTSWILVTIQRVHDVVKHLIMKTSFEGENVVFQRCREDDIMIKAWRNANNNFPIKISLEICSNALCVKKVLLLLFFFVVSIPNGNSSSELGLR